VIKQCVEKIDGEVKYWKRTKERSNSKPIILAKIPLSEVFRNQCD
jgi:hypothetical protein